MLCACTKSVEYKTKEIQTRLYTTERSQEPNGELTIAVIHYKSNIPQSPNINIPYYVQPYTNATFSLWINLPETSVSLY